MKHGRAKFCSSNCYYTSLTENPAYFKGKKHTKEAKKKMSLARTGKKASKITRERMRQAQLGRKHPESVKKKISEANKGRIHSAKAIRGMKESQLRSKSHAWRGGIACKPYAPGFDKYLKKEIRERDNYSCKECNRHEKELGKTLCIHHIDYNKNNNNPNNLLSLCFSCHSKTNWKRNEWTKHYQSIMILYLNQKHYEYNIFSPS